MCILVIFYQMDNVILDGAQEETKVLWDLRMSGGYEL